MRKGQEKREDDKLLMTIARKIDDELAGDGGDY